MGLQKGTTKETRAPQPKPKTYNGTGPVAAGSGDGVYHSAPFLKKGTHG